MADEEEELAAEELLEEELAAEELLEEELTAEELLEEELTAEELAVEEVTEEESLEEERTVEEVRADEEPLSIEEEECSESEVEETTNEEEKSLIEEALLDEARELLPPQEAKRRVKAASDKRGRVRFFIVLYSSKRRLRMIWRKNKGVLKNKGFLQRLFLIGSSRGFFKSFG